MVHDCFDEEPIKRIELHCIMHCTNYSLLAFILYYDVCYDIILELSFIHNLEAAKFSFLFVY